MARKKKEEGASVNMDSFLDILTCLVGVLVLIIILTSIDAAQTKLLISTPMATRTDMRMIFIECRDDQLFHIPLEEIQEMVEEEFMRLDRTLTGDPREMTEALRSLAIETETYVVDSQYALVGQIALSPKEGLVGEDLSSVNMQMLDQMVIPGWFGELLKGADKNTDLLTFLVRDDSFAIFRRARAIAWVFQLKVAYELMPQHVPIIFGLGGEFVFAQ